MATARIEIDQDIQPLSEFRKHASDVLLLIATDVLIDYSRGLKKRMEMGCENFSHE